MECPYCGAEMEKGSLQTQGGDGLFYMPRNKKYGMFPTHKSVEKKGGVILDGPYMFRFNYVDVTCFICKACKKIIIQY